MPYPNEHSLRLEKPSYDKYRRTEGGTIFGSLEIPKTISIIWGHLNSEVPEAWHPQALRFPTKNWSLSEAKSWIKKNIKNYISFTMATNEKNNAFLKFSDFINESTKPSDITPVEGDIVTVYIKKQDTSKIGDANYVMGGELIGNSKYETKIVVDRMSYDKKFINKSYFLDGELVPFNIRYWYSVEKGAGEKILKKIRK